MAGGILRTLGWLIALFGALALLGGGAAAGFGYFDEQQNQDRLLPDPDRSEMNEALLLYGGIGAGAGVVALLVGIVIASTGRWRSDRALRREIRDAKGKDSA